MDEKEALIRAKAITQEFADLVIVDDLAWGGFDFSIPFCQTNLAIIDALYSLTYHNGEKPELFSVVTVFKQMAKIAQLIGQPNKKVTLLFYKGLGEMTEEFWVKSEQQIIYVTIDRLPAELEEPSQWNFFGSQSPEYKMVPMKRETSVDSGKILTFLKNNLKEILIIKQITDKMLEIPF